MMVDTEERTADEDRGDELEADIVEQHVFPYRKSKPSYTAPYGREQLFVRLLLRDDHGKLYRLNSSAWSLEPLTEKETEREQQEQENQQDQQ